jgi:DeoR/GlpR family transcriptional regulator of sugar metabolism
VWLIPGLGINLSLHELQVATEDFKNQCNFLQDFLFYLAIKNKLCRKLQASMPIFAKGCLPNSSTSQIMLKKERQALILKEVNIHNKIVLPDLSVKFDVSEDTIRRDIQELDEEGQLIRVRGGALSKSFQSYTYRHSDIYAYKEKTIIASKAISLLHDEMMVLISGGTTNLEVARLLPDNLKITFFTPSIPTALQLMDKPNCETIFLGGRLSNQAKISVGVEVISTLMHIRPDLCLLGTNSFDYRAGLTDSDWDVVAIKKSMVEASAKVALLTISEKLNTSQKLRICGPESLDYLITELEPDSEMLEPYKKLNIRVL